MFPGGKFRSLVVPCSRNARPATMRVMPKICEEYLLKANGRAFFLRLPPGYGVAFNPGYDAEMLLPPDGVAVLKQDLGKAQ